MQVVTESIHIDTKYLPSLDGVFTELSFDEFTNTVSGVRYALNANGFYDICPASFSFSKEIYQECVENILMEQYYPNLEVWDNAPQIPQYYIAENLSSELALGPQLGILLETEKHPMEEDEKIVYTKDLMYKDAHSLLNSYRIKKGWVCDDMSYQELKSYEMEELVDANMEAYAKEGTSEEELTLQRLAYEILLWLQQNTTKCDISISDYNVPINFVWNQYDWEDDNGVNLASKISQFLDLYYELYEEQYRENHPDSYQKELVTGVQYVLLPEERVLSSEEVKLLQKERRITAYKEKVREEE